MSKEVKGEPGLEIGDGAVAAGANLKRLQQIKWGWQDNRTAAQKRQDRGEEEEDENE